MRLTAREKRVREALQQISQNLGWEYAQYFADKILARLASGEVKRHFQNTDEDWETQYEQVAANLKKVLRLLNKELEKSTHYSRRSVFGRPMISTAEKRKIDQVELDYFSPYEYEIIGALIGGEVSISPDAPKHQEHFKPTLPVTTPEATAIDAALEILEETPAELEDRVEAKLNELMTNRRIENRRGRLTQLKKVARVSIVSTLLKNELDEAVIEARSVGASWSEIAALLGITPQAAQQRWRS